MRGCCLHRHEVGGRHVLHPPSGQVVLLVCEEGVGRMMCNVLVGGREGWRTARCFEREMYGARGSDDKVVEWPITPVQSGHHGSGRRIKQGMNAGLMRDQEGGVMH